MTYQTNTQTWESQEALDQRCFELRTYHNLTWRAVADHVGWANESSARTAAARYQRNNGVEAERRGYHYRDNPNRQPGMPQTRRALVDAVQLDGLSTEGRFFGIEIEFTQATKTTVARHLARHLGVSHVHVTNYHNRRCISCHDYVGVDEWKIEHDASVDNGSSMRSRGGEVVSPKLSGEHGFAQMRAVMLGLQVAGAKVDHRCGLHVHLDANNESGYRIAGFIRRLAATQNSLKRLVSKSRWTNHYSALVRSDVLDQYAESFESRSTSPAYSSRYGAINVTSYPRYGTIEVRLHQGTLNPTKCRRWVELLIALFDTNVTLSDTQSEYEWMSEIGLNPEQIEWYRTRMRDLYSNYEHFDRQTMTVGV